MQSSLPIHSVNELVAYARANPGKLTYGSSGNGANNHLAMELLKSTAKVDLLHVPYKSGAAALNDFIGGQVHVIVTPQGGLKLTHVSPLLYTETQVDVEAVASLLEEMMQRAPCILANCRANSETPPVPCSATTSPAFTCPRHTSAFQAVTAAHGSVAASS